MIVQPSGRSGHGRIPGGSEKPCRIIWRAGGPVWTSGVPLALASVPRAGRRQRLETVPAGVHRTAICKQLGSMARLEAPLSAFGLDEWGQLRIFLDGIIHIR